MQLAGVRGESTAEATARVVATRAGCQSLRMAVEQARATGLQAWLVETRKSLNMWESVVAKLRWHADVAACEGDRLR